MARFLTDVEAARYLGLPVDIFRKMEVHQCPAGYNHDMLADFAANHGLPIGEPYNIITVGYGEHDERIHTTKNLEEALILRDKYTRALILPEPNENVWESLKYTGTRLVLVGCEGSCHVSTPNWDAALLVLEMFFEEALRIRSRNNRGGER